MDMEVSQVWRLSNARFPPANFHVGDGLVPPQVNDPQRRASGGRFALELQETITGVVESERAQVVREDGCLGVDLSAYAK
jgi:hypothetical protein